MVTILVYLKCAKKLALKCSHHTGKEIKLCELIDMLISLIVVITSQCICISNHQVLYFQSTWVNYTSINLRKKQKVVI